jgi:hypothetical protein
VTEVTAFYIKRRGRVFFSVTVEQKSTNFLLLLFFFTAQRYKCPKPYELDPFQVGARLLLSDI